MTNLNLNGGSRLCLKSRLDGYRTTRGSERDKNSTNQNDGAGAIVVIKIQSKSRFSLSLCPARYRGSVPALGWLSIGQT